MNKGNERVMAILTALRKMPRWALILITVGVIVVLGVAMFLLLPQQQPSQGDTNYLNSTGLAFGVFLKMGVVVLLIVGLAIVLKRWQSKTRVENTKLVSVLETVHLSPHRTLYLVSVDGQRLLIGGTDQNLVNLFQLNPNDSSHPELDPNSFADVLANAKTSSETNEINKP